MPVVPHFLPSKNAPLFHNGPWDPGINFDIQVPGLPAVPVDLTRSGLCGGMAFLTRDSYEAGTEQLRSTDSTTIPLTLARHLVTRLVQSFDGGPVVARWIAATAALDHDTVLRGPGLFHSTVDECEAITADVDNGLLCPIGIILVQSALPWDVFQGHVELVWGYERAGDLLTLRTYDCNFQGSDTITISIDVSEPRTAKTILTNGTDSDANPGSVRGFFRLPYTYADPGPAYIDRGEVLIHTAPPLTMQPGQQATVTLGVRNTGSTTWSVGEGYRIGSQAPRDNMNWGIARVDLISLDPGMGTLLTFPITAPIVPDTYQFSWQLLREGIHWFSSATQVVRVPVGLPPRTPVPDVLEWSRDSALKEIADAGLAATVTGANTVNSWVITQRPDAVRQLTQAVRLDCTYGLECRHSIKQLAPKGEQIARMLQVGVAPHDIQISCSSR